MSLSYVYVSILVDAPSTPAVYTTLGKAQRSIEEAADQSDAIKVTWEQIGPSYWNALTPGGEVYGRINLEEIL